MSMPEWMAKYPCPSCGVGYGNCREFAQVSLMCCTDCSHPGHKAALPNAWTISELEEMWAGREMPDHVLFKITELRRLTNPEVGPRCPACRMGLVTHVPEDPKCIINQSLA